MAINTAPICSSLNSRGRLASTSMCLLMAILMALLASCHCDHKMKPALTVGNLVCADGSIISASNLAQSKSAPVAVIFHVNNDSEAPERGFAVWLKEMPSAQFADSLGVEQGTSTDINAFVGNANTYSLFACEDVGSPMAAQVFAMWSHGQSGYVPSLGEMRLLYRARNIINPIIIQAGGDIIPVDDRYCWYWTSTEVDGQADFKAWLYSLGAGVAMETPKTEEHKVRPIITIFD